MQYYEIGHLHSIPIDKVFTAEDCGSAFRHMQKSIHIGKIIVAMPKDGTALKAQPVKRSYSFSPDDTYFLVGGLGGLGKSLSRWLVQHGARKLLFLSRSAGKTAEHQTFIEELHSQGCTAVVIAGDVAKCEDVERAVRSAPSPIKGVFQLSLVLQVGTHKSSAVYREFVLTENRTSQLPE